MAVTYCTAQDVSQFNQLIAHDGTRVVFGGNVTLPTQDEVDDFIETAEELIEKHCNNAWGTRFISVANELNDVYGDHVETAVHLKHQNVIPFDDGTLDKLEVWINDDWEEWLAIYTHGRGDDFFLDQALGKVYFFHRKPPRGKLRVRVTYRYKGGSTVPKAVRYATALQVGIFLLNTENLVILFPEGESADISVADRIRNIEKMIEKALRKYVVSEVPIGLSFEPVRY